MTPTRFVSAAWAAAVGAAALGLGYVYWAPVPGSDAVDTTMAVAAVVVGAVGGIWLESRWRRRRESRRGQ